MTHTVIGTALAALGTALAVAALTAALLLGASAAAAATVHSSPGVETTGAVSVVIAPAEA